MKKYLGLIDALRRAAIDRRDFQEVRALINAKAKIRALPSGSALADLPFEYTIIDRDADPELEAYRRLLEIAATNGNYAECRKLVLSMAENASSGGDVQTVDFTFKVITSLDELTKGVKQDG